MDTNNTNNTKNNNFFKKDGKIRPWFKHTIISLVCTSIVGVAIGGIFYSQSFPQLKIVKVDVTLPQGHDSSNDTTISGDVITYRGNFDTYYDGSADSSWEFDPTITPPGSIYIDIAIETLHGAKQPNDALLESDGYWHYTSSTHMPNDAYSIHINNNNNNNNWMDMWVVNNFFIREIIQENRQDEFYLFSMVQSGPTPILDSTFCIKIFLNLNKVFGLPGNLQIEEYTSQNFEIKTQ